MGFSEALGWLQPEALPLPGWWSPAWVSAVTHKNVRSLRTKMASSRSTPSTQCVSIPNVFIENLLCARHSLGAELTVVNVSDKNPHSGGADSQRTITTKVSNVCGVLGHHKG